VTKPAASLQNRVFVDTNVLVYDFFHRNPGYNPGSDIARIAAHSNAALTHISRQRGYRLFTAAFSLARLVSLLQQRKVPKSVAVGEVRRVLSKMSVVGLPSSLMLSGLDEFERNADAKDLEDVFQYLVCRQNRCRYLLTANGKDFRFFRNVLVVHPESYRIITFKI